MTERRLTKTEVIDQVASRAGLTKKDAGAAVDAVLVTIREALQSGEDVSLTGFGRFHVQNRSARIGVNPRNPREKLNIPAARVPKFSAGLALKAIFAGDPCVDPPSH